MKLRRKYKPSRVLANPKVARATPGLHGAHVRAEKVIFNDPLRDDNLSTREHLVLYATDAYTLVRIDLGVPDYGDEPGPIPAPALKHMERGVSVALNEDTVRVGITRYDRVPSEVNPGGQHGFPDVDALMAKVEAPPPERKITLAISPKLLSDLAAAMDANDGVNLTLDEDGFMPMTAKGREQERWYTGAIKVEAKRDDQVVGMMMPIRPIGA